MNEIKIYVVSPDENFEEFMNEFKSKNGTDSYIAISVKDYENLAKNFAELRRYIEPKTNYSLLRGRVQPLESGENDKQTPEVSK